MIEVQNISKSFHGTEVLQDVSVSFKAGMINLIIGASGSGKTVLMKSMVGLIEVDKGKVLYDDRNFSAMTFKQRKAIRKEIGMLFQGTALFDSKTVEENILFPLDMFSTEMEEEEKLERVNFCLERVNLSDANDLYPAELSGGMKKRVGIARAIVHNPKYLFCDEPTSGLDPQTSIVIDRLIHDITKEFNTTTIINTHDMNSVMEIGDNVVFLHDRQKWWEGSNEEIINSSNKELNNFMFASDFLRQLKETHRDEKSS